MSFAQERDLRDVDFFAADAAVDARAAFIRNTYLHLSGAIVAFMGLETLFLSTPAIRDPLVQAIAGHWWIAFVAFMIVGWVAERWAQSSTSQAIQYAGLALYTAAEAVIFVPLLYFAQHFGGPTVIPNAALLTAVIFVGLTAIVFLTRADFSFLRTALWMGSLAAFGIIIAGLLTGFSLGLFFSAGMVVLISGYILYYTSNVLHHYRTDQYVAAALALFACVATLLWYIVQIVARFSRD